MCKPLHSDAKAGSVEAKLPKRAVLPIATQPGWGVLGGRSESACNVASGGGTRKGRVVIPTAVLPQPSPQAGGIAGTRWGRLLIRSQQGNDLLLKAREVGQTGVFCADTAIAADQKRGRQS